LEEEEKFPEGVGCCFVGRGVFDVVVWRERRSEDSFEEGVGCLVKGGFVIAFKVWVEVVAEGGWGKVEEAEPGEGGGPIGVWEKGFKDGGVGVGTGVGVSVGVVVL
jgi:hypothetical protein